MKSITSQDVVNYLNNMLANRPLNTIEMLAWEFAIEHIPGGQKISQSVMTLLNDLLSTSGVDHITTVIENGKPIRFEIVGVQTGATPEQGPSTGSTGV